MKLNLNLKLIGKNRASVERFIERKRLKIGCRFKWFYLIGSTNFVHWVKPRNYWIFWAFATVGHKLVFLLWLSDTIIINHSHSNALKNPNSTHNFRDMKQKWFSYEFSFKSFLRFLQYFCNFSFHFQTLKFFFHSMDSPKLIFHFLLLSEFLHKTLANISVCLFSPDDFSFLFLLSQQKQETKTFSCRGFNEAKFWCK